MKKNAVQESTLKAILNEVREARALNLGTLNGNQTIFGRAHGLASRL